MKKAIKSEIGWIIMVALLAFIAYGLYSAFEQEQIEQWERENVSVRK